MVDFWTSGLQVISALASSRAPKILIWDLIKHGPGHTSKDSIYLNNPGILLGVCRGLVGAWDNGTRVQERLARKV